MISACLAFFKCPSLQYIHRSEELEEWRIKKQKTNETCKTANENRAQEIGEARDKQLADQQKGQNKHDTRLMSDSEEAVCFFHFLFTFLLSLLEACTRRRG